MGNVMAASQAPGGGLSPPGSMPPPPPPTVGIPPGFAKPEGLDTKTQGSSDQQRNGLENPGSMEDLHKKCKDVFPVTFEGAKLMVNKGLSNHFQVSHTINLSGIAPSGYRFGATYVGTKQISPNEAFPIMLGDIDPSGNLNANIIHQFGQRIRTKFLSQINGSKFTAVQLGAEYRGDDFTGTFTMGNIDLINESGVLVSHYLQSVTPSVALGAELAYQYGPNVPGCEIAVLSAAARYTGKDNVVSGTIGGSGLHLCYYQKASEQLQIGVELETNFRVQESVATIGYQVDLPKADLCFREHSPPSDYSHGRKEKISCRGVRSWAKEPVYAAAYSRFPNCHHNKSINSKSPTTGIWRRRITCPPLVIVALTGFDLDDGLWLRE